MVYISSGFIGFFPAPSWTSGVLNFFDLWGQKRPTKKLLPTQLLRISISILQKLPRIIFPSRSTTQTPLHRCPSAIHLRDKDLATTHRADHGRLATPGMLQKVLGQPPRNWEVGSWQGANVKFLRRIVDTKWQMVYMEHHLQEQIHQKPINFTLPKARKSIHRFSFSLTSHRISSARFGLNKDHWESSTHKTRCHENPVVQPAPPSSQCKNDDLPTQSLEPENRSMDSSGILMGKMTVGKYIVQGINISHQDM